MKRQMIRVIHNLFPRSLFALAVAEILVLIAAYTVGLHIYMGSIESDSASILYSIDFLTPLLWACLTVVCLTAIGLYWRDNTQDKIGQLFRIAVGFIIGFLLLSITLSYAYNDVILSPSSSILITAGIGFVAVLLVRILFHGIVGQDFMRKKFLVIGAGNKAQQLLDPSLNEVELIGFIPFSDSIIKLPSEKLLTYDASLVDIAKHYDIDSIVVALDDRRKKFPIEELIECKMNGIKIIEPAEFFETHKKHINLSDLAPSSIIFSNGFRGAIVRNKSKRLFDILVSTLLFLLTLPLMLVVAIAILIESRGQGTIIYRQLRVGKDNKPFEVLKFRTMCIDAEKDGKPRWASTNDPRITAIGGVLRKYRIDELPQLINVMRGEMSFVGPRPERPEFVKQLAEEIPYYQLRHRIKPGITGWAQICYAYGDSEEDAREKLQYDLYYIKNYNLLLDINVLLQTAHTVLWGRGAR